MELCETLCICGKAGKCGCQSDLSRFFSLIHKASQRVSTHKPTSGIQSQSPSRVLIDKLTFQLGTPIPENIIAERLNSQSTTFRKTRHKDHRWCYEVSPIQSGTYLRLWSKDKPFVNEIVSRPSAFENFQAYQTHLKLILTDSELQGATLKRIDLAIDYPQEFQSILQGFDFTQKQSQFQFLDKSAKRTGLRIGKGNEVIQIYNKALEAGLSMPMTRIEIQLKGRKLPTKQFNNFESALLRKDWNPFDLISLNDITTINQLSLSDTQKKRLIELDHHLGREGYFSARRLYNENGNLSRDYLPLLQVSPWKEQPNLSYQRQIATFFNQNKKEQ